MQPQYWLVGAMFGGSDDNLDTFIKRGYWYCWDPCLDRKYFSSDKQLNDAYKELMAGFDESRKSSLKKEQIAWIREKETKCQTGGKDGGGSVATLANAECKLRFTEQRLELLKNYK